MRIVAIATPSAQAVVAATKTVPVVFSAVTDPVAAKLVPGWEAFQDQRDRRIGPAGTGQANGI